MILIKRDNLQQISKDFDKLLSDYLVDKRSRDGSINRLDNAIDKADAAGGQVGNRYAEMLKFYRDNRVEISNIDTVKKLRDINASFYGIFREDISIWKRAAVEDKKNTSFGKFVKYMTGLYNGFITSSSNSSGSNVGMWLAQRLSINTCPYCNRHYTFSIAAKSGAAGVRPQFDHFLPKSRYPITALCLYNLVPSCADCNKLKREEPIEIHPYEDCFDNHRISFKYDYEEKQVKIQNGESNRNVNVLRLDELYKHHSDIATEILRKAEAYNAGYYDGLISQFSGIGLTKTEIENMVWGNTISVANDLTRPFSKLTRDLCIQFGVKEDTKE